MSMPARRMPASRPLAISARPRASDPWCAQAWQALPRRYLLVLACNFVFALEAALVEYGVAAIAANLKAVPADASSFLFWYFLATAVGVAGAPWIAQRVRPDRALLVTFALAVLAVLQGSRSASVEAFALARVGIGLLQANMGILLGTLILRDADPRERARIFGATGVGIGLGYFASPFALAAAVYAGASWRQAYVVVAVGLLALLPFFWRLQRQPQPQDAGTSKAADVDGTDLLSIAFLAFALGGGAMLLHPSSPLSGGWWPLGWGALCAFAVFGVFWASDRCDNPALDVQLIRLGGCGNFLLACLLSFFGTFMVAFVAPYLALSSTASHLAIAVLLLVAFPIGFALGSAIAGQLGRRVPPGQLAVCSHAGYALACLAGAGLTLGDSPVWLVVAYLAGGAMRGATIAPMAGLVVLQVPVYRLPSLLSSAAVFRSIGMLLGVSIVAHAWRLHGLDAVLAADLDRQARHTSVAAFGSAVYAAAAALQAVAALLLLKYRRLE